MRYSAVSFTCARLNDAVEHGKIIVLAHEAASDDGSACGCGGHSAIQKVVAICRHIPAQPHTPDICQPQPPKEQEESINLFLKKLFLCFVSNPQAKLLLQAVQQAHPHPWSMRSAVYRPSAVKLGLKTKYASPSTVPFPMPTAVVRPAQWTLVSLMSGTNGQSALVISSTGRAQATDMLWHMDRRILMTDVKGSLTAVEAAARVGNLPHALVLRSQSCPCWLGNRGP